MEKLIYVLVDAKDSIDGRVERVATDAVPVARGVGGERLAVLVPVEADEIRSRRRAS